MSPVRLANILLVAFWTLSAQPKPPKWHTAPFYAAVASR
jgi:hypothetical protein